MSDDASNPASPTAVKERAEQGKEIINSQFASGAPGQKQPAHDDPRVSAEKTVEQINNIQKQFQAEQIPSSAERAKKSGNYHPVPPEERSPARGPQTLAAADTAAGALGAARDAITSQLVADARIASDPRYERDQKVYELGATGKLGKIAPSEAEVAAALEKTGLSQEVADKIPKNAEEQVAQDMPRLEAAEVAPTTIPPGVQELSDKNNGLTAQQEGKTGEDAVARTKSRDEGSGASGAVIK